MNWVDVVKYLVHGTAFTILFLIFGLVWVLFFVVLVGISFIIGLVIGLGLLFLITGFLNSLITTHLWFEVKGGFWTMIAHGFVLFIILFIVNSLVVTVPNLAYPSLAMTVATIILDAFVDGLIAKKIAGYWRQEYEDEN